MSAFVIAYDFGTTGLKTCLFEIGGSVRLAAGAVRKYALTVLENGGAEQDPGDWWEAMCAATRSVLHDAGLKPGDISGISFCSQMQGLVLVDREGNALRPAMSYMDQRSERELREGIGHGPRVAGANIFKLLTALSITGAAPLSVKDPIWKYKWVERNEPHIFSRVYKWLDVKEYLILRCTGEFVMTRDSAYATLLYDTRKGREGFSRKLCRIFGVNQKHLPRVVRSTDRVGNLTAEAAGALGLAPGTAVFGGGGDASLIGVGAGAVTPGSTHIYSGTSGWVSTVVERQVTDVDSMIASIVGAEDGRFHYFAELETAGKCLEWVKDHLALDEIGIYLDTRKIPDNPESVSVSLYDYMMKAIRDVPAGSRGVIFTPWLHGNRCPFEDHNARGMFFNISLETGKTELIHAVLEGICYHLRWQLESQEKKVRTSPTIRFVGGGALSERTCGILANVLGRPVETVENPQNAGAVGAALVMAVGLGFGKRLDDVKNLVAVTGRFEPDPSCRAVHDANFKVFKALYANNRKNFRLLNARSARPNSSGAAAGPAERTETVPAGK